MAPTKQTRFDIYEPLDDLVRPEVVGLLPSVAELELATPNLSRRENVVLVGSSTKSNESLVARFKWRPDPDNARVTLISRLTFVVGQQLYEFEETSTYEPSLSTARPNTITQYGSMASKLKLSIACPYRRMRLTFSGHLTKSGANQSDASAKKVFLKLSCVVNTTTKIFDFLNQYDEDCARQIYESKKTSREYNSLIKDLLSHDRHEHGVRMIGEYLLIDSDNTSNRAKRPFVCWGLHVRHFVDTNGQAPSTKRIYATVTNGQTFHIGNSAMGPGDDVDFGYTIFESYPISVPIDKPFEKLNWSTIELDTKEFQVDVNGQGKTYSCLGRRRADTVPQWFAIEMNNKTGWAYVSLDDELVESQTELDTIERSRRDANSVPASRVEVQSNVDKSQQSPLVVSIREPMCASSDLVGSKAASLAQLDMFTSNNNSNSSGKLDYKVPYGLVLTQHAYDSILAQNSNLKDEIGKLQQLVASGQLANLQDSCKQLQSLFKETKLPTNIGELLREHIRRQYSDQEPSQITFAVRSSSWGEDEDDMSAAGQLDTLLDVRGAEALDKATMACFSSKFSYENVEYKRQHGLPLDLPMAVVVQEMVGCDRAGVMFTCDPTTGDDGVVVITANYGLGESVVSGQADPDSIRVRVEPGGGAGAPRSTISIERVDIGQKKVIVSAGHNHQEGAGQYDRSKCCLDEGEILRLAKCGLALEHCFNAGPRDIEWGYMNGQLYLFQSRPVTGLEPYTLEELVREYDRPYRGETFFYTRANVGEVMPYAMRPFTMSYSFYAWNFMGARMGMRLKHPIYYGPHCSSEVHAEKYHPFFSLINGSFISLGMGEDKPLIARAVEISMFGHEMAVQPDIIEASKGFTPLANLFQGARFNWIYWPLRFMPVRTVLRARGAMIGLRDEVRNLKLATGYETNKMLGLYNQLKALHKHLCDNWENHVIIIMFASGINVILSAILSKYIKDPLQLAAATNKFLASSPDVLSAEIPRRTEQMAQLIKSRGQAEVEKFVGMADDQALEYLCSGGADDELGAQFNEFIEKFGHRCYNEFEVADMAWRENPKEIVAMIKKNCSSTTVPSHGTKPTTFNDIVQSLGIELSLMDWAILKHLIVPRCQQMLVTRELTKDVLIHHADITREASRMLAEEMRRNMRIPDTDLFYYLMYDELEPLVNDHQPAIVMQALRRRNLFKQLFDQEPWKFGEIIRDLVPNHLKPAKELDEAMANAPKLKGTPASSGKAQAKVCLVKSFKELDRVLAGTILVTHSTDIAFSPIFPLISGIITEVGGLISHGAVVAREYGLPSVIGIEHVTSILEDGEEILLDADNGTIVRLSKGQEAVAQQANDGQQV